MFPLKTILLPTDYSVASESALALARDLAEAQGARLIGMNVIQPPNYAGEFNQPGPPPPEMHESLYRWIRQGCGPDAKMPRGESGAGRIRLGRDRSRGP